LLSYKSVGSDYENPISKNVSVTTKYMISIVKTGRRTEKYIMRVYFKNGFLVNKLL